MSTYLIPQAHFLIPEADLNQVVEELNRKRLAEWQDYKKETPIKALKPEQIDLIKKLLPEIFPPKKFTEEMLKNLSVYYHPESGYQDRSYYEDDSLLGRTFKRIKKKSEVFYFPFRNKSVLAVQVNKIIYEKIGNRHSECGIIPGYVTDEGITENGINISIVQPITNQKEREELSDLLKPKIKGPLNFW